MGTPKISQASALRATHESQAAPSSLGPAIPPEQEEGHEGVYCRHIGLLRSSILVGGCCERLVLGHVLASPHDLAAQDRVHGRVSQLGRHSACLRGSGYAPDDEHALGARIDDLVGHDLEVREHLVPVGDIGANRACSCMTTPLDDR
jgi:hypothetical protein